MEENRSNAARGAKSTHTPCVAQSAAVKGRTTKGDGNAIRRNIGECEVWFFVNRCRTDGAACSITFIVTRVD